MKQFWEFSKGESIGITTLLILTIVIYLFVIFYSSEDESKVDITEFELMVTQFENEQHRLADSVSKARSRPDRSSRYAVRQRRPSHEYRSSYIRDTFSSKPLRPIVQKPGYAIQRVELNRCDTSEIMDVPLFGAKRAQKIIEYRDKLGGFYAFHQLKEIYILQNMDEAYLIKYFSIDESLIQRIAINKASYKEMIRHPYFDAYLVKTILRYRQKYGAIKDTEHFQQITHAYPELMDKLSHYLLFD